MRRPARESCRAAATYQIGDLFASFMDEEHVEAVGHKPLAADLAAIDDLRDLQGLAELRPVCSGRISAAFSTST